MPFLPQNKNVLPGTDPARGGELFWCITKALGVKGVCWRYRLEGQLPVRRSQGCCRCLAAGECLPPPECWVALQQWGVCVCGSSVGTMVSWTPAWLPPRLSKVHLQPPRLAFSVTLYYASVHTLTRWLYFEYPTFCHNNFSLRKVTIWSFQSYPLQ